MAACGAIRSNECFFPQPLLPKISRFENGIYITESNILNGYFNTIDVDFSLHATYPELKELIKRVNPKTALVVHVGKRDKFSNGHILEMDVMDETFENITFLYPENNEIYSV